MLNFRRYHCALIVLGALATATPARAELVFALLNNDPSVGQQLVTFDSQTRAVVSTVLLQTASPISPLASIDVRPNTGQLYGYDASGSQLYTINTSTGALTTVGAPLPAGSGEEIDFNPTVDLIRLVGNSGQNFRLNPTTGAIAGTDTTLAYAAGDPNFGDAPNVRGAGYTNSVSGAITTMLYDIDVTNDVLVTQNPANSGQLQTVGLLGVDLNAGSFGTFTGFDISGATGVAYLTDGPFAGASTLFTVDLLTGAATSLGEITGLPQGRTVASIAVAPIPEPTSLALGALGLAGLFAWRRRTAKRAAAAIAN